MMTRIYRMAVMVLIGVPGLVACGAGRPTQARPLSDRTLALILGSNTNQKGGNSYGCGDAAMAANNTYITSDACAALPNAQANGKTCIACQGPSATGYYNDANGTNLTFPGQKVDCSKSPNDPNQASTLLNEGTCQPSQGLATASCQGGPGAGANRMGPCPAGNFFVATKQPAQPVNPDSAR